MNREGGCKLQDVFSDDNKFLDAIASLDWGYESKSLRILNPNSVQLLNVA